MSANDSGSYWIEEMTGSPNEVAVVLSAEELDELISSLGHNDDDLRTRLLEARAHIEKTTPPLPRHRVWRVVQERDDHAVVVWSSPLDDEAFARHVAKGYAALAPAGLETRLQFQEAPPEPPPWEEVRIDVE